MPKPLPPDRSRREAAPTRPRIPPAPDSTNTRSRAPHPAPVSKRGGAGQSGLTMAVRGKEPQPEDTTERREVRRTRGRTEGRLRGDRREAAPAGRGLGRTMTRSNRRQGKWIAVRTSAKQKGPRSTGPREGPRSSRPSKPSSPRGPPKERTPRGTRVSRDKAPLPGALRRRPRPSERGRTHSY